MKNKLKGKNGLKVKRVSRFKYNKVESNSEGFCRQNLSVESVKTRYKKVRRKLLFLFSVKIKRFL